MRIALHVLRVVVPLVLLIGLPLMFSPTFRAFLRGENDAVTSATVALEKPSGEYVVLINPSLHTDVEALECWKDFFEKGETEGLYNIFEDISCTVASSDTGGKKMAESFMSRLPKNQMKVRSEDITLMISKAENGRFDVIVMSKEMAESCGAWRVAEKTNAELLTVKDEL